MLFKDFWKKSGYRADVLLKNSLLILLTDHSRLDVTTISEITYTRLIPVPGAEQSLLHILYLLPG